MGAVVVETGRLPAEGVQRMFDRIAPVYDAMNRVMTAGLDRRWRRITVEQAVRSGGRLAILELTTPRGLLAPFYRVWFDRIVPLVGRVLPGGAAYTYLPASVRRFRSPEELADLLAANDFSEVRFRLFAGSIVALH